MDWTPYDYPLSQPDQLLSPALLLFREPLESNLELMLRMAGDPARLRPHCKTHKMAAVSRLLVERGITKHKAATIAEAEMLAESGAADVLLAYNLVGPNVSRFAKLVHAWPQVQWSVTVDHPSPLEQLEASLSAAGVTAGVWIDIDPGRQRTGVRPGVSAEQLCRQVQASGVLHLDGFHLYDGHRHETDREERRRLVLEFWEPLREFIKTLATRGITVPRVVCGGTPTFPIYAEFDDPLVELSPGTCLFHDAGYAEKFPDLREFRPAALLFTRVISRPTANRLTLDLGTKGVAADPPLGQRVVFPRLPDAVQVLHNEEHLVLETDAAEQFTPGDWLLAIPRHVCPNAALYPSVPVIEAGRVIAEWDVTARNRQLHV